MRLMILLTLVVLASPTEARGSRSGGSSSRSSGHSSRSSRSDRRANSSQKKHTFVRASTHGQKRRAHWRDE